MTKTHKHSTDSTLTLESIHDIVSVTKRDWDKAPGLADLLQVPLSIQEDIRVKHYPVQEQRDKLIEYWLTTSPSASWETLAGVLYMLKQEGIVFVLCGMINIPGSFAVLGNTNWTDHNSTLKLRVMIF